MKPVAVEKPFVLHISMYVRACLCVHGALANACARVALLIQHATRRRIAICGLSGSTIFSTLSHKRHDFRKKMLLNVKCVF